MMYEEMQRFVQAEDNKDRVLKEFELLRNQYPDQYIGVVKEQVKYHNSDLDKLLTAIRDDVGTTKGVFIIFIPSKHRTIAV